MATRPKLIVPKCTASVSPEVVEAVLRILVEIAHADDTGDAEQLARNAYGVLSTAVDPTWTSRMVGSWEEVP